MDRAPRWVYVDTHAEWGTGLHGFERFRLPVPWHVYAFEGATACASYLERLVDALNARGANASDANARGANASAVPRPPPTSLAEARRFAHTVGCPAASWRACVQRRLRASVRPPSISDVALRLARARTARVERTRYTLIPRVATSHFRGVLRRDDVWELVTGRPTPAALVWLPSVGLAEWLVASFAPTDFVVLRLRDDAKVVVDDLVARNATRLVDAVLWRCHTRCALVERLRAGGVAHFYWEDGKRRRSASRS